MHNKIVYPADVSTQSFGRLRVNVTSILNSFPVEGASISVGYTGVPDSQIETIQTDATGNTPEIELPAPPIDYSLEPGAEQPYSEFTLRIRAEGFSSVEVDGVQILPEVTAIQNANLEVEEAPEEEALYVIPPHTLFGDFPPKIAESEIKSPAETGQIVLDRVVIPEFIVVHDGPPTDRGAKNHYVRYRDYINNVASSEIYSTWPEATILANVLAIQSFTLNRVFTEWYRNRGFNFTITSSTAFDHKWVPGRNIFEPITRVVDTVFVNYLSRPDVIQPILTQYCDGQRTQCPNWMTQWGSKSLGEEGYTAIEILRNFYGSNMFINTAPEVAGVPVSWPGTSLQRGSRSNNVRTIQNQLNVISRGYPLIPKLAEDGVFGPKTENSVKVFQQVFKLPQTGVVDFTTWYKISEIYVAVSRIAELT